MGEDEGTGGSAVTNASDPDQIQQEIEATREELGDTVEALARKTDVKARAEAKVRETKAAVTGAGQNLVGKAQQASPDSAVQAANQATVAVRRNPLPAAVTGALVVGFIAGRISRR
jgi:ElaB/YqjD/DUF883 family membrane-anchored ribosome-binding protein